MVFFNNPPFSNTSNYSTLAEVYNMRQAFIESEDRNTEHMARVLRELKKLRPILAHDGAHHGADAEKRDAGNKKAGETADSYASDVKSIKEAVADIAQRVADIAQRLSALVDTTASQQHAAACVNEHSVGDMSDCSIVLVYS